MKWLLSKKMKFSKNQKGLTLVELLAVIVILGVIAGIAVPSIGGIINSSKTNADAATVLLLKETAERYMIDTDPNGLTAATTTSVTVAALVGASYLKTAPNKQSAATTTAYVSIAISYSASGGWVAGAVT